MQLGFIYWALHDYFMHFLNIMLIYWSRYI